MKMNHPRSSLSVRLHPKHGKLLPKGLRVGKRHSMIVSGKITGMNSDQFGHGYTMDMDDGETGTDHDNEKEPKSLTKALRKRHMKTGRFTGSGGEGGGGYSL